MVRFVRQIACVTSVVSLISAGTAPLFASEKAAAQLPTLRGRTSAAVWIDDAGNVRPIAQPTRSFTRIDADFELLRSQVAAMAKQDSKLGIEHVRRLLELHDAGVLMSIGDSAMRRSALASLEVTIDKRSTAAGIETTFSVRGKERVRVIDAELVMTPRSRQPKVLETADQPDGSSLKPRGKDELEELIAQADAEATAQTDETVAYLTGVADEADAIAADMDALSQQAPSSCAETVSGPADRDEDCYEKAFHAFWEAIGIGTIAKAAIDNARNAWTSFRTLCTTGIVGMTAAAAEAAILDALGTLLAACMSAEIVAAVGLGSILYISYKVYQCFNNPAGDPTPQDFRIVALSDAARQE